VDSTPRATINLPQPTTESFASTANTLNKDESVSEVINADEDNRNGSDTDNVNNALQSETKKKDHKPCPMVAEINDISTNAENPAEAYDSGTTAAHAEINESSSIGAANTTPDASTALALPSMASQLEFHTFPRLPSEVRLFIWELACKEPQIVSIVYSEGFGTNQTQIMRQFRFQSQVPCVLHVNKESRRLALSKYQLFFSNAPNGQGNTYFNPDIDTCFVALANQPYDISSDRWNRDYSTRAQITFPIFQRSKF
jgi:hypothetical protein